MRLSTVLSIKPSLNSFYYLAIPSSFLPVCLVNPGLYQTVIGRSSDTCQESSWRCQVKYLLGSNLLVITRQELRSQEAAKGLRITFRYVLILVVLFEWISVLFKMKNICETFRLHQLNSKIGKYVFLKNTNRTG